VKVKGEVKDEDKIKVKEEEFQYKKDRKAGGMVVDLTDD
jgi:hypothetical protein